MIILLIIFRFGIGYIGHVHNLPDSSYTSSSEFGAWHAYRMRLYDAAGFIALKSENSWIRIDMLNVYTILGLYLRKYNSRYVTMYHLKASVDGVTQHYIEKNITSDYLMNEDYTTYWFDNATDGRYWTIELVHNAYVEHPFLAGDFIGYI